MKNPFKSSGIKDTLVNVGIGGAANVAIDYVWNAANMDETAASISDSVKPETIKNAIKIIGGALVGSMIKSKYGHAATDGIATVGASNLISDLINGEDKTTTATANGLPNGTIGRIYRMGQKGFARKARGAHGVAGADFMQA